MPFTDPRDGMTNDIIDGRVIIAFKEPPDIPVMDPNYFDVQRDLETDPYYDSVVYHYFVAETAVGLTQVYDPEIAAFLAAENVEVYSEWPEVGGMGVLLPPGQTVLDAVLDWPSEYPGLIESADPDVLLESCDLPETMPNDDIYGEFEESWHLFADNEATAPQWWTPPDTPLISPYSCDATSAWGPELAALGGGVYIGIFDTGVDYGNPGLQENSALHGINTYDDGKYSSAKLRTQGGGEPWDDLMERSQAYASGLGHGTAVAGTACATAGDDFSGGHDVHDVLGVAPAAKYLPFAIKAKGSGDEEHGYDATLSMSAILNAFSALGGIKGIYENQMFEDPAIGI